MPLISRNGPFPPGGYQFFQPETGWHAPAGLRFVECVDAIIKHRLDNPRFGLPTDWQTVADTLDTFTCFRINHNPHYCLSPAEAQKKTASLEKSRMLEHQQRTLRPPAKRVGVLEAYSSGAQILKDWLGEGGKPVDQELSQARANTCIRCPLNSQGDWRSKVGEKIAQAILEQLRVKNELGYHVQGEDKLGTCDACLCHLPLKVHVPLQHILAHTSQDTMATFHPDCWIPAESKKKILCVIPFHNGDIKLTEKLLNWIKELGGCPNHPAILLADANVTDIWANHLLSLGKSVFQTAELLRGPAVEGWPAGPNSMHKMIREHIALHHRKPWLWLEPDAVPLKAGWLDAIQAEYTGCGKQCLGAVMTPEEPHMAHRKYLAGVAVYPPDARKLFSETNNGQAFDVSNPDLIVPHSHHSSLIHHRWGKHDLPPTFKLSVSYEDPVNTLTPAAISRHAVLFHRNKDGTLINVLRESKTLASRPGPSNKIIPMIAHFDQSSGYGILSIQIVSALLKLGYQVELYPPSWNEIHGNIPANIKALFKQGRNPHPWNFVLFPVVFQPGNLEMKEWKDTAYLSMWESTRLTSKIAHLDKDLTKGLTLLNSCTVAIVPCAWNASCYSACGVETPIRICPLGADTDIFQLTPNPVQGRLVFGTAAKTAYGGVRKGFNLVVAAFRLAFKTEKDVMLRVKSFSEDPPIDTGNDPRIQVLQSYLDQPQLVEWYRSINVFVSGSASEGWGRHQHEAMCVGRPVIGVNFGGVCEFFSQENGYAVDFRLVPAEGIYESMGVYAKPNVESMAKQMRRAYENRAELALKSEMAATSARRFTVDHSAQTLVSILKEFRFL